MLYSGADQAFARPLALQKLSPPQLPSFIPQTAEKLIIFYVLETKKLGAIKIAIFTKNVSTKAFYTKVVFEQ